MQLEPSREEGGTRAIKPVVNKAKAVHMAAEIIFDYQEETR